MGLAQRPGKSHNHQAHNRASAYPGRQALARGVFPVRACHPWHLRTPSWNCRLSSPARWRDARRSCSPAAAPFSCEVLIVDGTNVLCSAHANAWAARWDPAITGNAKSPSPPQSSQLHAANFHAWLHFLLLAANPRDAAILVLDYKRPPAQGPKAPKPGSAGTQTGNASPAASMRKQHVPGYLDKRHARQQLPGTARSAQAAAPAASAHGLFTAAAKSLGFVVVWSEPGWEADDMIGSIAQGLVEDRVSSGLSLCQRLLPGHRQKGDGVPPTITIASSDSDMQQLLALSAWGVTVVWMELLQWPSLSVQSSGGHPTAMVSQPLAGLPWIPVRLHRPTGHGQRPPSPQQLQGGGPGSDGGQDDDDDDDVYFQLWSALQSKPSSDFDDAERGLSPRLLVSGRAAGGASASGGGAAQVGEGGSSEEAAGLAPALYPHYLALVGKPEAGVKGVGLSAAAAKKLLRRFGSVQGIAEAWEAGLLDPDWRMLPPAPPAGKKRQRRPPAAGPGATSSSGAAEGAAGQDAGRGRGEEKLVLAHRNLHVTLIHCDPARVPWPALLAGMQEHAGRLNHEAPVGQERASPCTVVSLSSSAYVSPSGAAWTPVGAAVGPLPAVQRRDACVLCHPYSRWHVLSCGSFVEYMSADLSRAGLRYDTWHITAQGALVDLLLQAKGADDGGLDGAAAGSNRTASSGFQQQRLQVTSTIVVLGPADFVPSKAATGKQQHEGGPVEALGVRLKALAGARASPEHIPRSLKVLMLGQMQVHVKHLKAMPGWRVAVVPFYEVNDRQAHASLLTWIQAA